MASLSELIKSGLIKYSSGVAQPKMNLICFPFAGGGTVNYAKWRPDLPKDIDLYALNLPGRERFFGQPCLTDFRELIESLASVLSIKSDLPMAFFGHSFGGLTAYFTALELKKTNRVEPIHLFISARIPPNAEPLMNISDLNDEEFKTILLDRYQGIPKEILNSPELLNLFIPIIKQDFKLYEQYPQLFASFKDQQVSCNLSTIGFIDDRPKQDTFYQWEKFTRGTHQHISLPGGHFEIVSNWKPMLSFIESSLSGKS